MLRFRGCIEAYNWRVEAFRFEDFPLCPFSMAVVFGPHHKECATSGLLSNFFVPQVSGLQVVNKALQFRFVNPSLNFSENSLRVDVIYVTIWDVGARMAEKYLKIPLSSILV